MHPERNPSANRFPDPLAERLRALPAPPVPPGLEARLLAAVPSARRRWRWAGVAAALAAACLVAVFARATRDDTKPVTPETARRAPHRPPQESVAVASRVKTRHDPDLTDLPTFAWPLEQPSSLSARAAIPPDLLD
jgi:hypothetical protein